MDDPTGYEGTGWDDYFRSMEDHKHVMSRCLLPDGRVVYRCLYCTREWEVHNGAMRMVRRRRTSRTRRGA